MLLYELESCGSDLVQQWVITYEWLLGQDEEEPDDFDMSEPKPIIKANPEKLLLIKTLQEEEI